MRVLYAIPRYGTQFTANETHGQVVRDLGRLGVDVEVLSFTTRSGAGGPGGWGPGMGEERVYRHVQGARLAERALAPLSHWLLHYEFFASMLIGLLQVVRERRYDLLHVEGAFPLGAVAALTAPVHRTPYLVTTTGGDLFSLPGQGYGYGHYWLPGRLISLALRRAAWVRTNSALSLRLTLGYGADPRRLSVLPVSISDVCYPPPDVPLEEYRAQCRARLAARHSWGDRPVVVCVGRLFWLKAQELLIEALPEIVQRVGPVQLCIVGPSRDDAERGDYLTFLQRRAAALGVDQLCTFTGNVALAEIKEYLAAAQLLAVPSRLEGLNRVVIEAAAVGTPSVISDGAGAAELVARYACGLVVPGGAAAALAQAISRLLGAPGALAECGTRALALASEHTSRAIAQALYQLYTRLPTA